MPSSDLCTRDEVKSFLGITGTTYDSTISRLVTAASDAVERFCRRRFARSEYSEFYDGRGADRIVLLQRPVVSVENVWDDPSGEYFDDELLETEEYEVDSERGIIVLRQGRFFDGKRNVKVEYTAGYSSIPEDIAQAAALLAAAWFREGRELVTGEARPGRGGMPEGALALLRPYREIAA
jgi:uncharacterized phiE125 gp8 family phage protein